MGGRKIILTWGFVILGFAFGVYCVEKGIELSDAGIYWTSASVAPLGYLWSNIQQKKNSSYSSSTTTTQNSPVEG